MEQDNKYTLNDLVTLSADQKPLEFQQAFDNLIIDKIQAAIDNRKLEIAQGMFNAQEEE
jgi:late competence protein required for DNA uptake (superfamily II DNA/RNA helicase)